MRSLLRRGDSQGGYRRKQADFSGETGRSTQILLSGSRRSRANSAYVISFRHMTEPTYTSRIHIDRIKGPIRHAYVTPFTEPIRFGVHGAIKQFYGVEPDEELPATLDHIIAAVGG